MNMMKFFFSNAATHDTLAGTAENAYAVHRVKDPYYKNGLDRLMGLFEGTVYDPLRQATAAQVGEVVKNAGDYLTLAGNGMSEKAPKELLAVKKADIVDIAHHYGTATVLYRKGFMGLSADLAHVEGIDREQFTAQIAAAGLTHKIRAPGV